MAHAALRRAPLMAALALAALLAPLGPAAPVAEAPGLVPGHDAPTDVLASPDGAHVYVGGRTWTGTDWDVALAKLDAATGQVVWKQRFGEQLLLVPELPSLEWADGLAVSPDGRRVFLTGWLRNDIRGEIWTLGVDTASGAMLWEQKYHGPRPMASWAVGQGIAISHDGQRVYVVGLTLPQGPVWEALHFDFTTIAYDAATGAQLWLRTYEGDGEVEDWGYDIAVSPDDATVYITGRSWGSEEENWDYATLAYDARTGADQWVARYHGPQAALHGVGLGVNAPPYTVGDWANALVPSPDGRTVYVTGRSFSDATGYDYATLAYDAATGAQRWLARLTGPGGNEDGAYHVAVSPDGRTVAVTGWSHNGLNYDYLTAAYDAATGALLWERRYDGPAVAGNHDAALHLAFRPQGDLLLVSGWSVALDLGHDYATLAYEPATGALVWSHRERGAGNNGDWAARANSVGTTEDYNDFALSPGGAYAYMAGAGRGALVVEDDFLVVKYDAATGARLWGVQVDFSAL